VRSNSVRPHPDPLAEWEPVPRGQEQPATVEKARPLPAGPRPRGDPLTATMPVIAPDGTVWVAYIEGAPPKPSGRWRDRAVLPGRRLRFDGATASRVTSTVPAGSPFLRPERLADLLAGAEAFPPPIRPAPPPAPARVQRRAAHGLRRLRERLPALLARCARRWGTVRSETETWIHYALDAILLGARRAFR
jgi:hypothetical protein